MSDILCIYYSRTGNTKKAMEEIAAALDAELAELRDNADRSGWRGWLRCGLDAMRKDTRPVAPLETARPLGDYRLVILGTPVWAGRSSAVMRSFLKDRGGEIRNAAYVLTRSSGSQYQEVYRQMDLCVPAGHLAAVSLRSGDVGWAFWQEEFLRQAAYDLAHARPTTANRYGQIACRCADVAKETLAAGRDPVEAIVASTVESLNRRYSTMQVVGDYLANLIPNGGAILTQCFGETIIGTVIRAARRQNKTFWAYCAETRPYLQGARLTSSCFAQMGIDTTVLTDNMIAYAMEREGIDLFTSAADSIAWDGHIANKIGTFQIAILAKYFGVPYYVTGIPDREKRTKDDIVIEMRDPAQVLSYRGIPNTLPGVKAIYPSFDVVPPHLISGVVTDKGVYVPYLLGNYFDSDVKPFY